MIEQTAGSVGVRVFTDGWPRWPQIEIDTQSGQGVVSCQVGVEYLHDLRFCIDRVLAQLDALDALATSKIKGE